MQRIIILLIIFSCTSCNSDKNNTKRGSSYVCNDSTKQECFKKNNNEIILSIATSQIDLNRNAQIKATIINNTKYKIVTDSKYTIEYYDSEKWLECVFPDMIVFNDILLNIYPLSYTSFDIYLYPEYMHYKKGLCRIKKIIEVDNKREYLYANFTINN